MDNRGFDLCHHLMDVASLVHLLFVTSKSFGRYAPVVEVSSEVKTKTSQRAGEDDSFYTCEISNSTASKQNHKDLL